MESQNIEKQEEIIDFLISAITEQNKEMEMINVLIEEQWKKLETLESSGQQCKKPSSSKAVIRYPKKRNISTTLNNRGAKTSRHNSNTRKSRIQTGGTSLPVLSIRSVG